MTLVRPFRALRPAPGHAAEVLAPPYDVLTSAEARVRAAGKPWSFLHISKPEIDLDPAIESAVSPEIARATYFVVGPSMVMAEDGWKVHGTVTSGLYGRKRYSHDMIADIGPICRGLFGFMDHLVRYFGRTHHGLALNDGVYSNLGVTPAYGEVAFLKQIIPVMEYPSEASQ